MGFFSDLKEDLSQAVNELMPGETPETAKDEDMISLDEMLKNIDALEIPTELEEPEDEVEEDDEDDDFMITDSMSHSMIEETEDDIEEIKSNEPVVEETVADESVAEEIATEDTVTDDAVIEEVVSEETITEETTAEDAATEEAVVEENVTEETVMEDVIENVMEETIAEENVTEEPITEDTVSEETNAEWDLDSMLQNALTGEAIQAVEKTEENKGAETTMDISTNREVSDETSIITAGMSITGDIASEGSLDLIGTVIGNIDVLGKLNITGHIQGNSKAAEVYAEGAKISGEIISDGAVKIGASTVIVGNITASSAVIAGAVKGDIDVRGPVVLDASAIVMGNIKSKSVQINNGAVIEGMCSQCYADVSPTSFFEDYKMEMKKSK